MTNQTPKPDPDESWESLAEDLFGIEFTPADADDESLSLDELELTIDDESLDDDLDEGELDDEEVEDEIDAEESAPILAAEDRLDDDELSDREDEPFAEESDDDADPEGITLPEAFAEHESKAGDKPAPSEADEYWDPLVNWDWEESARGSHKRPDDAPARQGTSHRRPVAAEERRPQSRPAPSPQKSPSRRSPEKAPPAPPPRQQNVDDFGVGIWEEKKTEPHPSSVRANTPDDRSDDADDEIIELEVAGGSDQSAESVTHRPERKRRRRRRRKSSTSTDAAAVKPGDDESDDTSEAADILEDTVESISEESGQPEGEVTEKPRSSRRRRGRSRRGRGEPKPAESLPKTESVSKSVTSSPSEFVEDDDEFDDDEIPTGAISDDELDEGDLEEGESEDQEDDGEPSIRDYHDVPSWEEAISYILNPRRAEAMEKEAAAESGDTATKEATRTGKPRRRRRRKGPKPTN